MKCEAVIPVEPIPFTLEAYTWSVMDAIFLHNKAMFQEIPIYIWNLFF